MKNRFMLIFFCIFALFCLNFHYNHCTFAYNNSSVFAAQNTGYKICTLNYNGKLFEIDIRDCMKLAVDADAKINRESLNLNVAYKKALVEKILKMGFSYEVALCYSFYGLRERIEQVLSEIESPYEDSKLNYNAGKRYFYVTPSKNGVLVDRTKLYFDIYNALMSNGVAKIETTVLPAKIESSSFPLFRRGGFSTCFLNSNENRKHNIFTAVDKISGTIVKPNEEFSFNEVVGRRNEENGYKVAKIISNGEYVDGMGGGVCQVSTTLYNAAVLAGLEIVESHNHTLKPGYIKSGFDAMVNYGSCDLRFRNNTAKCIGIIGKYTQNECFFEIFGEKCQYNVEMCRKVIKTMPHENPQYILDVDNPELVGYLPLGTEKVVTVGKDGEVVDSFVELYERGRKVKEIKLRRSIYSSQNPKIVVGTCL